MGHITRQYIIPTGSYWGHDLDFLWSRDVISFGGLYKERSYDSLKLNSKWVQTTVGHTKIKEVLATNVPLS